MNSLKKYWPDVVAVALFVVIAFAYFLPADLEGRILYQHDASAGRAAALEQQEYYDKTGDLTRWSSVSFSRAISRREWELALNTIWDMVVAVMLMRRR